MAMTPAAGFRHLNLEGAWPLFELMQLSIDEAGHLGVAAGQRHGSFRAGPFEVDTGATRWHAVRVLADPLRADEHLRLFSYTSDLPAVPAWDPATVDAGGPQPDLTGPGLWRAAPPDACDVLLAHQPARYLWLAGTIDGIGAGTPVIRQMRLTFNHESYLRHLPAIYRDRPPGDFLERVLDLVQSMLGESEQAIADLPTLFDPWAAPDRPTTASDGAWLDWLSGWLAFQLDEAWPTEKRRTALAGAFALHGKRGTVEGLRQAIELYAGATAHIDEPARTASIWSLGATSVLGFTTMLAAAEPQGAVLDTTSVLDGSHLAADPDASAALFTDLAHRFCVQVYQEDAPTAEAIAKIRSVIEREKPAHTTYDLCVAGANMRVGQQARLGIDAFVGGPPPDRVPSAERRLGVDSVLAASPDHRDERVGHISVRNDTRFEDKETMR
jgi:phage tail-like protein